MDPIDRIIPKKDTSFAMLLEAQRRDYSVYYFEQRDLWLADGAARGRGQALKVSDTPGEYYSLGDESSVELGELDVILMRKDPPFDMEYVYTTYLLERAEAAGSLVVNRPDSLRTINEKAYTAWFPDLAPPTLITRSMDQIREFADRHGRIVVKPLDGMGGRSIFSVTAGEPNTNVIVETLTDYGQRFAMAQAFIPEISDGDKRVLVIDGVPAPYALARIPSAEDGRGNLVMGATGEGRELTARDLEIATRVGAVLRERGVLFAGLDVIGDALTEINVTSPTGVRELDRQFDANLCAPLFDAIESRLR